MKAPHTRIESLALPGVHDGSAPKQVRRSASWPLLCALAPLASFVPSLALAQTATAPAAAEAAPEAAAPEAAAEEPPPAAGDPPAPGAPPAEGTVAPAETTATAGAAAAEASEETTANEAAAAQTTNWGPATAAPPAEPTAAPMQPAPSGPELLTKDELPGAGYVPGYRKHVSLSASRYAPKTAAFAGGLTPGFGAPTSIEDWTFKFAGYMSMSAQFSVDHRRVPAEGQSSTVFHTPPQTVDMYGFFTGTSTVPGNWVGLRFSYGNARVTANLSVDTWNPTRPTSFYSLGSQYFINNAYLDFNPKKIGPLALTFRVGRFNLSYGNLSKFGNGVYVAPVIGGPQGQGELVMADITVSNRVTLNFEHGLMGSRDGTIPHDVIAGPQIGWRRPLWVGSFVNHLHAGFTLHGKPELKVQAHYMSNFSFEDRNEVEIDVPGTIQVDESNVKDGRIDVYGVDARVSDDVWGWLGAAVSYVYGENAYPLKGIWTYGGYGEELTDRFWGPASGGNGGLLIFGVNYNASIGKIVNPSFSGDGPDIVINTGAQLVRVTSPYTAYDGKLRHKYAIDAHYTVLKFMGIGCRFDYVVPNSFDDGESFSVLAPRLTFDTDWISHEAIQLIYAKWFYGPRTRNEGTGLRTQERLDDQMLALNFNMWW